MSFVQDAILMSTIVESEKLSQQGLLYQAFTTINRNLMKNFTRLGVVRALIYLFNIIDESSVKENVYLKSSFINTTYQDVVKLTYQAKNKPQMQFWAGCLKLCQFRNDNHLTSCKKMENLMKARQHFRFTLMSKPKHILAPYLLTVCDSAYFDMNKTILYPKITSKTPEEYYSQVSTQQPAMFLSFSYILGKLSFYVDQHYLAECFLNMALCRQPTTAFEDHLSFDTFALLNQIAELKSSAYC